MDNQLQKYKLHLSYEGTPFSGWQIQQNSQTVQEVLETVFSSILQEKISITGASRTDAGVHARMQVAHFSTQKNVSIKKLFQGVNALLPPEIRLYALEETSNEFHARYHAQKKEYIYNVCTSPVQSPFKRRFSYHYTFPLDMEMMSAATPLFIGTKNFRAFANSPLEGTAGKNPVRTLFDLKLIENPEGFSIHFYGDGFLYKMVRNITGTLLEVGKKRLSLDSIEQIFGKEERPSTIITAPAHGLTLNSIEY